MSDISTKFTRAITQFEAAKRQAVGADVSSVTAITSAYTDSFEAFATEIYKWYYEVIKNDRLFLHSIATPVQLAIMKKFEELTKDQRHVDQHHDYSNKFRANTWRNQFDVNDARALHDALLTELAECVSTMADVALIAARNHGHRRAWQSYNATSSGAEIRRVAQYLGMTLSQGRLDYLTRDYEGHPEFGSAVANGQRSHLAAATFLGRNIRPLSEPYDQLLDDFKVAGRPQAKSLLLLAHGIAAHGHGGEKARALLVDVWALVHPRK